jgi:hypothetical protein
MSHQRQAQWSHRLQRIQTLRAQLTKAGQYDRAYEAYLVAQHMYDRWADEVFAAACTK